MPFIKNFILIIALSFTLFNFASVFAAETSSKPHKHIHKGYYKPGAAVELSYDYDGQTELGELESLTLTLHHHYSEGFISAVLLEPQGFQLLSYQELEHEAVQGGAAFQLPLQLSGTTPGAFYISLEVTYENAAGERSLRVLSLPIQIGQTGKRGPSKGSDIAPSSSKAQKAKDKNSGELIVFSAQEVIK